MFDLEAHLFTILPGESACLRCLYPEPPRTWRREFPVFGAVSGTVGCLGAMEAIKLLAGFGQPLVNRMLVADLRTMTFRQIQLQRRPTCPACHPT
jgi:molybdopterin-synthase adenylyltransferase